MNAGAEASMVGAMADWFAVTALFKHPLGLPIPHTALIPKRKDELGRGLQEFVGENFLQEDIIRDRVAAATISLRVGRWLDDPVNVRRVVDEAAELLRIAARQGDRRARRRLRRRTRWCRGSTRSPSRRCSAGCSTRWCATTCTTAWSTSRSTRWPSWLVENPGTLRRGAGGAGAVVGAAAAQRRRHPAPPHASSSTGCSTSVTTPRTTLARRSTRCCASWPTTCSYDADTQARTEKLKDRLLDHPQVLASSVDLWNALRRALQASLADPQGAVRTRMLVELTAFAKRLVDDADLRKRLDRLAADAAVFAIDRYGAELTAVITHTIERWDGKEAARRIELHVGRDLQFIRINGTIVGGLVGVRHPRLQPGRVATSGG